jgi:hypothetical protein
MGFAKPARSCFGSARTWRTNIRITLLSELSDGMGCGRGCGSSAVEAHPWEGMNHKIGGGLGLLWEGPVASLGFGVLVDTDLAGKALGLRCMMCWQLISTAYLLHRSQVHRSTAPIALNSVHTSLAVSPAILPFGSIVSLVLSREDKANKRRPTGR